jgi:Xaa-Pro aminopeptidase
MMRTVKSAEEIERIRFASKSTDQWIQELAEGLKEEMRDHEIPALIEPVYLMQSGYAGIHVMSSMPMREPDFAVSETGSPISREA